MTVTNFDTHAKAMTFVDTSHLQEHGYVVVDGLVRGDRLDVLREACDRVVSRARQLQWPDVRIVGKQFPPWSQKDVSDIWGIQRLLDPQNPEAAKFLEWYTSPEVVSVVSQILDVPIEKLQLELFNILINPEKSAFSLNWHRDSIPAEATIDEELEGLKVSSFGTQWNTALYDDSCLIVVPGSHKRPRTEQERAVTLDNPKGPMPGEMKVNLKAGQTVFYHNNILHRGSYGTSPRRQTLHASMGYTAARARNLIQHNLLFLADRAFEDLCAPLEKERPYVRQMRESINKVVAGRDKASLGYIFKE